MAVVLVRNKYDGWSGGATSEGNGLVYEVIRRRYRITKLVYVNNPGDGPEPAMKDKRGQKPSKLRHS
ncbi:MAG: hypothetical protein JWO38_2165 [Gemmataceae bacterium]|nr:hypothetical protein [Gemmataceae bacterium]